MRKLTGQLIYVGPTNHAFDLNRNRLYRDGITDNLYPYIEKCAALGELFVPIAQFAAVRKELNFDWAGNMRGTTGKFVAFYREVQKWLASQAQISQPSIGVKHHA